MRWVPIPLDHLLEKKGLKDSRVQLLIGLWCLFILVSLGSVFYLAPSEWIVERSVQRYLFFPYLAYVPMLIGILLLFWVGFEWGFIPVFLSSFMIAHSMFMTPYWAILFGIAFVLGLAIYGLAYYCVPVSTELRSLKSIAFFTVVSFIAAIASSLGSFVWSGYFNLTALETMIIWKGWWTGLFLQSVFIVGPLLFFFTPGINRLKKRYFESLPEPNVSLNWLYSAIASVALILIVFIAGSQILGNIGFTEQLAKVPVDIAENLRTSNAPFEIVSWISMGLVLTAGIGGIYLVGSWNTQLQERVYEQTLQLQENEIALRNAVEERDLLLKEIHDRVRSNLTMVLALLELQLKNRDSKPTEDIIKDVHSRIRSMAIIHETMFQTDTVNQVNLKNYAIKLSNRIRQSYKNENQVIETKINASDLVMSIDRAVPFAMILNELLVNAYSHAFRGLEKGAIYVELKEAGGTIYLSVVDNGNGLPEDFEKIEKQTLGFKLIRTLVRQLQGEFIIEENEKTSFSAEIPIRSPASA